MKQIGFDAELKMERAGFYPHGGGRMRADIQPSTKLAPLHITERKLDIIDRFSLTRRFQHEGIGLARKE